MTGEPMTDLADRFWRLAVPDNKRSTAIWTLFSIFTVMLLGVGLFVDPIPQPVSYHEFADTRACLGIENCGDVFSNAGFALAGLAGLLLLWLRPDVFEANAGSLRLPFALFFASVACVSAGSGYYHESPDSARLFWDRLPITVAFMSLFAAILADRLQIKAVAPLTALFVCLGLAGLGYWAWTESMGAGDLRFYILVQAYPLLVLLILPWLLPESRYSSTPYIYGMVGLYAAAKFLELFDVETLEILSGVASGHSLKHICSAAASALVIPMILNGARR